MLPAYYLFYATSLPSTHHLLPRYSYASIIYTIQADHSHYSKTSLTIRILSAVYYRHTDRSTSYLDHGCCGTSLVSPHFHQPTERPSLSQVTIYPSSALATYTSFIQHMPRWEAHHRRSNSQKIPLQSPTRNVRRSRISTWGSASSFVMTKTFLKSCRLGRSMRRRRSMSTCK